MKDAYTKLWNIYLWADGIYKFSEENADDHVKRVITRRFFVLLDDFIKIARVVKNDLMKSSTINARQKKELEELIKELATQYDAQLDLIRDKLSAHQQPIMLEQTIYWWNNINLRTLYVLYDDMGRVIEYISIVINEPVARCDDAKKDSFVGTELSGEKAQEFFISTDRLSLTQKNTGGMLACHPLQEKGQIIVSIANLLKIDFQVTYYFDDPRTEYAETIHSTARLMTICDLISLIDNLYEDNQYDKSLLSHWKNEFKGYASLEASNRNRDTNFETKLREVRNKFAAHIDTESDLQAIIDLFNSIDFEQISKYAEYHVNSFMKSCAEDIRTKMFLLHQVKLEPSIVGMSPNAYEPFVN